MSPPSFLHPRKKGLWSLSRGTIGRGQVSFQEREGDPWPSADRALRATVGKTAAQASPQCAQGKSYSLPPFVGTSHWSNSVWTMAPRPCLQTSHLLPAAGHHLPRGSPSIKDLKLLHFSGPPQDWLLCFFLYRKGRYPNRLHQSRELRYMPPNLTGSLFSWWGTAAFAKLHGLLARWARHWIPPDVASSLGADHLVG